MRGSVGASLAAREKSSAACAYWPRAPAIRPSPCQPSAACGVPSKARYACSLAAVCRSAAAPRRASARHADHCRTAAGRRRYRPAKRNSAPVAALRRSCSASARLGGPPLVLGLVLLLPRQLLLLLLLNRCHADSTLLVLHPDRPAPAINAASAAHRSLPILLPIPPAITSPCATDRAIPPRSPRHPSRSTGPAAGSRSSPRHLDGGLRPSPSGPAGACRAAARRSAAAALHRAAMLVHLRDQSADGRDIVVVEARRQPRQHCSRVRPRTCSSVASRSS